jgi:hypothetical protein
MSAQKMSPARDRVYRMLREGFPESEIALRMRHGGRSELADAEQLLRLAKDRIAYENDGGPVRWKGPWPVSYVRSTGERVFRVGAGHDVPEHSLAALGFRK